MVQIGESVSQMVSVCHLVSTDDLYVVADVSETLLSKISKNNPLTKIAYIAEKWLYQKADEIVFSIEGGKDYIVEKGWDL